MLPLPGPQRHACCSSPPATVSLPPQETSLSASHPTTIFPMSRPFQWCMIWKTCTWPSFFLAWLQFPNLLKYKLTYFVLMYQTTDNSGIQGSWGCIPTSHWSADDLLAYSFYLWSNPHPNCCLSLPGWRAPLDLDSPYRFLDLGFLEYKLGLHVHRSQHWLSRDITPSDLSGSRLEPAPSLSLWRSPVNRNWNSWLQGGTQFQYLRQERPKP